MGDWKEATTSAGSSSTQSTLTACGWRRGNCIPPTAEGRVPHGERRERLGSRVDGAGRWGRGRGIRGSGGRCVRREPPVRCFLGQGHAAPTTSLKAAWARGFGKAPTEETRGRASHRNPTFPKDPTLAALASLTTPKAEPSCAGGQPSPRVEDENTDEEASLEAGDFLEMTANDFAALSNDDLQAFLDEEGFDEGQRSRRQGACGPRRNWPSGVVRLFDRRKQGLV